REVILLGDVRAGGDHDAVHGVALDVHAEDLGGLLLRFLGGLGDLHAADLAAATGLHLGLDDDDRGAELLGSGLGGCRILRDDSSEHGNAVLLEEIAGLVLIQVHGVLSSRSRQWAAGRTGLDATPGNTV